MNGASKRWTRCASVGVLVAVAAVSACQGVLNPQPEDPGAASNGTSAPIPNAGAGGAASAAGTGGSGPMTLKPPIGSSGDSGAPISSRTGDASAFADAGGDARAADAGDAGVYRDARPTRLHD